MASAVATTADEKKSKAVVRVPSPTKAHSLRPQLGHPPVCRCFSKPVSTGSSRSRLSVPKAVQLQGKLKPVPLLLPQTIRHLRAD